MAKRHAAWRLCDPFYIAGLLLVAALFMWPAWQQPDGLWYAPGAEFSDLTVTHWPNMWFVSQTFREWGEIPLWRPLIMGGAPFVGNPLSALFYPPNWLFLLLPVSFAFQLLLLLHLFGAGAALYGLVRWSYRGSPFAAFLAGLGYLLSPKLIAHVGVGHVGLCQAYAWLPLALWLIRKATERRSGHWAACCGLALAMAFFADPRVAFYGALLLGSYAVFRLIGAWRESGRRVALEVALRLLLVPLVFAGIGAVQILPTLELMSTTTRATLAVEEAGRGSLPWRYLIGYLVANRGGYHEWMTYLGLAPLGLGLLALVRSRQRERWFWTGLGGASLLLSLGSNAPLYPLLFRLMPGLGWLRVPPRALLLVILSGNLMAAMGVDAMFDRKWSPRARRWATRGAVAGLLVCVGLGVGFALLLGSLVPVGVIAFAAIGAALMAVLLLSVWQRVPRTVPQVMLLAALLLDLWPVGRSLAELRPAEEVFAEGADPAAYLAGQAGLFRVYSPSYSIGQHVGAIYGLEQLDGVDPSQLAWTARFMSLAGGYRVAGYGVTIPYFPDDTDVRAVWRRATPAASLLGLLNGRFVVAEYPIDAPDLALRAKAGSSYVYENQRSLPRAFVVMHTERVAGWEEAQDRLAAGFDPASAALVEGGPVLDGPAGKKDAYVRRFSPNRIVIEAELTEPALLVLSEVWYPGWEVTVDGVEQPYYRVDGIVRGVYLEPGAHRVTWRYRPASLRWGAALTCGVLVAWILARTIAWRG